MHCSMWASDEAGVIVGPATAAHGAGTLRRRHSVEPRLQKDACWLYVTQDELDGSENVLASYGSGSVLRRLQSSPETAGMPMAGTPCPLTCDNPPPSGATFTSEAERTLTKTGSGWLRNLGNAWNSSLGEVKWSSVSPAAATAFMAKASGRTSKATATAAEVPSPAAPSPAAASDSSNSTVTAAGAADADDIASSASSAAAPLGNVTNVPAAKQTALGSIRLMVKKPKKCSKKE